jgi:hypothetical protein
MRVTEILNYHVQKENVFYPFIWALSKFTLKWFTESLIWIIHVHHHCMTSQLFSSIDLVQNKTVTICRKLFILISKEGSVLFFQHSFNCCFHVVICFKICDLLDGDLSAYSAEAQAGRQNMMRKQQLNDCWRKWLWFLSVGIKKSNLTSFNVRKCMLFFTHWTVFLTKNVFIVEILVLNT